MSITTGAQPHVTGLLRTPDFSIPARLRMTAAVAGAVVGRALSTARAYDGARGTSARCAVLREFAGTR